MATKKEQPKKTLIEQVLELLQKHIDTKKAILDDYLSGDDGMLTELDAADENLREDIELLADEEKDPKRVLALTKELYDEDEIYATESVDMLDMTDDLSGLLRDKGLFVIKIDTLDNMSKLEDFIKENIYTTYNEQQKYM